MHFHHFNTHFYKTMQLKQQTNTITRNIKINIIKGDANIIHGKNCTNKPL